MLVDSLARRRIIVLGLTLLAGVVLAGSEQPVIISAGAVLLFLAGVMTERWL